MSVSFDRNLDQKFWVRAQTVITTATASSMDADDAFKGLAVDIDTQSEKIMLKRNDNKSGRDELEKVDGKKGPYPWSINANVVPNGTAGTDSDIGPLYTSMFTETDTTAFTPDVSATDSGCTTSTTGDVVVGDVIVVPHNTDGEPAEAVYITGVSSPSGQGAYTWWPELSFTPSTSNEIAICSQMKPKNAIASTNYVTIKRALSSAVQCLAGALPDTFEIDFKDGEFVEQTFSGMARHTFGISQTALDGGVSAGGATLTVEDVSAFEGVNSNHVLGCTIEAEGANDAETVTISAVDSDNDQVTCSTLTENHGTGAVIIPLIESETTSGSSIAGVSGKCYFDDESTELSTELSTLNANFSIAEGHVWRTEFGEAESPEAVAAADRVITGSVNLTGKAGDWTSFGLGETRKEGRMLFYAGDTVGAIFGIMLVRAFVKAKVEDGGDGELDTISLTIDRALGTSGDDSFVIFYG